MVPKAINAAPAVAIDNFLMTVEVAIKFLNPKV